MPLRFAPTRNAGSMAIVTQLVYSLRTADGWTRVTAATYTVLPTDYRLWVEVNPCTVTFPLSSTMDHEVMIKDSVGTAGTSNITTAYSGGQTCDGQSNIPVNSNYGWVIIGPKPVGSGYTQTG